jgi:hypothetical protein
MPKSYSQYKYADVAALGLNLRETPFLKDFSLEEASDFLKETLKINTKRFLSTEKAKSEFIIAPVLFEIARKNEDSVSFFSGHNLDVDKDLGLKGFCDFLFAKVPESPVVKEPIFCIVEAKNDNLEKGIPQCIAEMYASRLFNERQKKQIDLIYGCVTTGYQWLFLKLDKQTVYQDNTIYALNDLSKILGILQFIVKS